MGQLTEDFCRRVIANGASGKHSPLTVWEETQFAWVWLKFMGCAEPDESQLRSAATDKNDNATT